MRKFENIIPNHVLESDVDRFPQELRSLLQDELDGRAILARKGKTAACGMYCQGGYITVALLRDYHRLQ